MMSSRMIGSGEAVRGAVAEMGGGRLSTRLPERQNAINSRTGRILIAAASHLLHNCNHRVKASILLFPFFLASLHCPIFQLFAFPFNLLFPLSLHTRATIVTYIKPCGHPPYFSQMTFGLC
jgi:hypothetical protein